MYVSAHCIPVNNSWLKNLIKPLKNKQIAGSYGRQEPYSFSSDFDKRDLLNTFGLDKKNTKKILFFITQIVHLQKKFEKISV